MNTTININLGGVLFHIDGDAYQKLFRYFETIKGSLKEASEQAEVMRDIEIRVSELFGKRQKNSSQIVSLADVDAVIAVMGQPEDYVIEDAESTTENTQNQTNKSFKKLYRDEEKGMIGGVALGLEHYFGIDAAWLRIGILLLIFGGFGFGLVAYIILWIALPAAKTTSERLEMTGKPVTISSIEKKVKEDFNSVSETLKNANYDKMGQQFKANASNAGNSISNFIVRFFDVFAKFLGIGCITTGGILLFLLLIGLFTLGSSSSYFNFPWQGFVESGNFSEYPLWCYGILLFLLVGIPLFNLVLLGYKLLAPNRKTINTSLKYSLFAVWIVGVALFFAIAFEQWSGFANEGKVVVKKQLNYSAKDTLLIDFAYNPQFANSINEKNSFKIVSDSTSKEQIVSNDVTLEILQSDTNTAYVKIEKAAKGKTTSEASQRAQKIAYNFTQNQNTLLLDNYFLTQLKDKFRDQKLKIVLFLPKETVFKVSKSVYAYCNSFGYDNPKNTTDAVYKISSGISCLNCETMPEEAYDENSDNNTTITINKNGVSIKNDSVPNSNETVQINKDGIIINAK